MSKINNIFASISKFKNKTAIIKQDGEKVSYQNMFLHGETFNKFFKKKNLIFLLADNYYEFIVFYVSAVRTNQAIIILNSEIKNSDLINLNEKYCPEYIFCRSDKKIDLNFIPIKKFQNFILYKNNLNKKKYSIHEELCILLSTSGTTGENKYVKISNKNIFYNTTAICDSLKIRSNDTTITTMPPFYSYALSIINTHLFKGCTIILNKFSLIDKNFWDLYKKFQPNNFNGVPYIYEIIEKLGYKKLNFKNLKYLTQAGGTLKNEVKFKIIENCERNNSKFFVMYGQTEASPRMCIMPWSLIKKNPSSVGFPIKGGKVWIKKGFKNNEKNILEGELVYEGKNVFMGYSSSFKDLKKSPQKNILETGDMGFIDKNKLIYVTGRKKRILKIFGIRISLDRLENELRKENFECICTGNDKKIKVIFENRNKIDHDKFKKVFKNITNLMPNYFEVIKVEKFNRNKSGKIIYS